MSVIQDNDFILMKHNTPLKIQNSGFCQHKQQGRITCESEYFISKTLST